MVAYNKGLINGHKRVIDFHTKMALKGRVIESQRDVNKAYK